MANIASVQVRLFFARTDWRRTSDVRILALLTANQDLSSYYVPVFMANDDDGSGFDVQYGGKWVHSVSELWGRMGTYLDQAWVRLYDGGGDHDFIFCYEHGRSEADQYGAECRYAFDEVHVTWRPGATGYSTSRPVEVQRDTWRLRLGGTYYTGNQRAHMRRERLTHLATPTTLACDTNCITPTEPGEAAEFLSAAEELAQSYDLLWRGRVVHRALRHPRVPDRPLHHYAADHWDNCADPLWLERFRS